MTRSVQNTTNPRTAHFINSFYFIAYYKQYTTVLAVQNTIYVIHPKDGEKNPLTLLPHSSPYSISPLSDRLRVGFAKSKRRLKKKKMGKNVKQSCSKRYRIIASSSSLLIAARKDTYWRPITGYEHTNGIFLRHCFTVYSFPAAGLFEWIRKSDGDRDGGWGGLPTTPTHPARRVSREKSSPSSVPESNVVRHNFDVNAIAFKDPNFLNSKCIMRPSRVTKSKIARRFATSFFSCHIFGSAICFARLCTSFTPTLFYNALGCFRFELKFILTSLM